jgi:hypothetical protein
MLLAAGPASPDTPGSIGGVIVTPANASSMHATVRLAPVPTEDLLFASAKSTVVRPQGPIKADKYGRFSFGKVSPGDYVVTVDRMGNFVQVSDELSGRVLRGVHVHVNAGEAIKDLRVEMVPTALISGRILDRKGKPVEGITVAALTATYENGRRVLGPLRSGVLFHSARTNRSGEYRIDGLLPAQYFVSANPASLGSLFSGSLSLAGYGGGIGGLANRTGTNWCDANLLTDKPTFVDGPVGQPLGQAGITNFYPGVRNPSEAIAINVSTSSEHNHIDFKIEDPLEARTTSMKGVIVDGSTEKRAEDAEVWITALDGGSENCIIQSKNGSFETINMRPGQYAVSANVEAPNRLAGRTIVDNTVKVARSVTVSLSPLFHLRGRIVVEGDSANAPVLDLSRYFVNLQPDPAVNSARLTYAAVSPDGTFDISSLMEWDYRVSLRSPEPDTYVQSIRFGKTDVPFSGFRMQGPPDSDLEVVIRRDSGTVSGVLAASDAKNSSRPAAIVLVPDSNLRTRQDLYRVVPLNEKGEFEMTGLAPGNYQLFAWHRVVDGAWTDPQFLRLYENQGTPVRITPGRTETVTVKSIAPWK